MFRHPHSLARFLLPAKQWRPLPLPLSPLVLDCSFH
jgi:hypothetical protein